jgi:hypothetical protein
MATFTTQTKALHLYTADAAQYLQVQQDGTTATQLNFKVKNTTGGTDNDTILPYFRNLTIRSTAGSTVNVATKISTIETNVATNAAAAATNAAAIATNAANIAVNSTAITTEQGARAAADTNLQNQIDAANTAVGASIATLDSALTSEITNRTNADTNLQNYLDTEAATRTQAVLDLYTALAAGDATVQAAVDTNTTNISSLQTNMTAILNMSTTDLDSFAEVATRITDLGVPAIISRLDALEAAVAALQNPP